MATYIWLCLILFSQFTSMLAETDTYIIHMDLQAMPKLFSGHRDWYDDLLSSIPSDVHIPKLHYTYRHAIHGFSARLSTSQFKAVQSCPGFVSATRDVQATVDTSHSFKFLGLNHYKGAWPVSNYGDDIIIGVVDTGVWPESESFNDAGMTEVPARWKGECDNGTAFNSSMCNRKLIGARYFNKGLLGSNSTLKIPMNSVRDVDGHGTHTASTAAGSYVKGASYFGYAPGTIRGMAPKARVAVYKSLWKEGGYSSDTLAAIDTAISDGVDVLSLSLSFNGITHLYEDPIAISTFAAMEKGIFVATSAGNSGATYAILGNGIPWGLTVGAGTIDRAFNGIVALGNGDLVVGQTLYPGKSFSTQIPLVFMNTCNDSREIKKTRHKIVVCIDVNETLVNQVSNLHNGQVAGGVFITNDTRLNLILTEPLSFPAIYLSLQDGKIIQDYITKGLDTTARFEFPKTTNLNTKPAPLVDSYSSRGPSRVCPTVLKPDLIAPGSLILAAWPENVPIASIGSRSLYGKFNLLSGTSMSAPHAAGVAALLKKMHPDWSPAAIRSAMMTTSYVLDNTKGPIKDIGKFHATADPLAMGAGHVNPNKALDPGLIYDANADDYVRLLCGMNYTMKQIQTITRSSRYCSDASLDLNYPSFIAYFETTNSSGRIQEFKRTVTNVGDGLSNYTAFLTPVDGYKVKVVPGTLTFTEKYQKRSYTLYVESVAVMVEGVSHGALTWVDVGRKHVVRSPIVTTTLGSELVLDRV